MSKNFMFCWSLLMVACCSVSASWFPDFSPQCGRDENLRNNYLAAERAAVENSLAEMAKRGINIIPTPKNLSFPGKDIIVPQKDLPGKITIFADKPSAVAAELIRAKLGATVKTAELKDYKPGADISILLLRQDVDASNSSLPAKIPDFYQGYVINTLDGDGRRVYVLAGKYYTGLLYAAVTFNGLVGVAGNDITLPGVEVSDWPDMRYRQGGGLLYEYRRNFAWGKTSTSTEHARQFIDWLLDHKINITEGVFYGGARREGLYAPYGEDDRTWAKEVCDYAKARGIYISNMSSTAVGEVENGKDDAAYGNCVKNVGLYFCWSNDALIQKRAKEMVRHLKDIGLTAVFIHSVDSTNEKWQDRCAKCRERFGDDRFAASAHVFNLYRDEIRKSFPDMPITIVPRPYGGNIDDSKHIEDGEMRAKGDLRRFSKMLAEDVYICHRCETSRENNLSWVHGFRQPMFSCVMAWYADPWLAGRNITPIYRYYRSYNYPLSDEIAHYGVGASASRDKMQCMGLSEFTWNLNSPGAAEYDNTPEKYADIWDAFGEDMAKNKELQEVFKRSCDNLFGKKNAKYFYNTFLLFTDAYFVENYQEIAYSLRKGLMPDIDGRLIGFMRRCYQNSIVITKDLEAVKKETNDPEIIAAANWYLTQHYAQRALAHVYTLTLEADQASRNGEHEKAGKLIAEAFKTYDEDAAKLKADWSGIQGQPCEILLKVWDTVPDLTKARSIMDMAKVKIQSRALMAERKRNLRQDAKEATRENKPIKVAVFSPDAQGGLTYGRIGLLTLLKGINDISVEEIGDLAPATLGKYDCVIVPDCKSFGTATANVNDIRAYVTERGGGMYFEHDSCGFNRFPLKDSVFPEIAAVKERIGEPPFSTHYKKSDRTLKIVKQHPITAGYADGTSYDQVYFDHLQLGNETGAVLAEDAYGKPVVVAGQAGNGRVVFNGGITYGDKGEQCGAELDKPLRTAEGDIIVNCVRWLAKGKKGTELIMADMKKEDKTLTDKQASVITFKPVIIPCKPLHDVVLSVQCFNAKDLRPISPKTEIAKIGEVVEKWEAEENAIVNADSYPQVKVVMEMSSKEGRGAVSTIVGSKE